MQMESLNVGNSLFARFGTSEGIAPETNEDGQKRQRRRSPKADIAEGCRIIDGNGDADARHAGGSHHAATPVEEGIEKA